MKVKEYLPYVLLISILLADIIIFGGLIKLFFNLDSAIIAGVIGFIGAVLGGAITYIGVRKTLQHRDRELFMINVTERLMIIDDLINKYQNPFNAIGFTELFGLNDGIKDEQLLNLGKNFYAELGEDKEKIYKTLSFDEIRIITFQKKTLYPLVLKKSLTNEERDRLLSKIREIFNVFLVSKKQLEEKYYEYRRLDK